MRNRLQHQTSPYLLQHADNPVDWYPWGEEAFSKAEAEDKPIFLSIGYSTCHWCHVMAHESFEDPQIAHLLNQHFVCIKVDREERPDVDQVYMAACQAMTGSGGWPTSLFLTPDRKPFFAGTYFPRRTSRGMPGFYELLLQIAEQWKSDRSALLHSAEQVVTYLRQPKQTAGSTKQDVLPMAVMQFRQIYDRNYGGFGQAPKFPTPHNLLFLLLYGKLRDEHIATDMALHTLMQMRKGGIYDHIGGGFSRYSTDRRFLVPHFEKMLYDNALMIMAYAAAYASNGDGIFLQTAEACAAYVRREMRSSNGGYYAAQDADSEGGEGMYYVFGYDEVLSVLGEVRGRVFCAYFGITPEGNFEGQNIPNRLHGDIESRPFAEELQRLYAYRRTRMQLHLDDKILTAWNCLMIAALAMLYRVGGNVSYLDEAREAWAYIEAALCEHDRLYVSVRDVRRSGPGFLDDYAFACAALLSLYSAAGDPIDLERAKTLCQAAVTQFADPDGGFFMSGAENEQLLLSVKETYDGAMPSGNAVMGFVLTRLAQLDLTGDWAELQTKQMAFLRREASDYPIGHGMFLLTLLFDENPPPKITAVCGHGDPLADVLRRLPLYADVCVLPEATDAYPRLNEKTTFYVCQNQTCLPPTDHLTMEGKKR